MASKLDICRRLQKKIDRLGKEYQFGTTDTGRDLGVDTAFGRNRRVPIARSRITKSKKRAARTANMVQAVRAAKQQ